MNQTLLRLALAGVVLLAGLGRLAGRDTEGQAEVMALYRRAEVLRKAGKWADAIKVYQQAVTKARDAFGPADVTTASLMNNLAYLYADVGQFAKAEPLYRRSLEIYEVRLGKDHPDVALALNNLAARYHALGQYARAEPLFRRSLAIREKKLGKDHLDVAQSLNNLAALYDAMGRRAQALQMYRRSLEIKEAKLGKDHPDVALSLNNLADLYREMGRQAQALPLFRRSLAIREKKLGKDHPDVITSLSGLALLYQAMGQYGKAEPLFHRCLEISESRLGKDHPSVATSLSNLALLYAARGQYARAEPLFKRCLAIREARLGKDHPRVAHTLSCLAEMYREMGRQAQALPLFRRSLAIREAKLGKDHPDVAISLNNLAALYQDMGQSATAARLYRRSLAIGELRVGKDHPDVATSLNNLAVLYAARDEAAEAGRLFDRARRSARRYLASVLPALSDADKADFFTNTSARSDLEGALSLALAHPRDADLAALAASWLVNGKGIDQESLASSALLARQSNDPALGKLARRLLSVRQSLAQRTFAAPRAGQEKQHLRQSEELSAQEQRLARELRLAGSKAALPDWVELRDVRKSLPAGGVLIDVARLEVFDFQGSRDRRWKAAHYLAWVTPQDGPAHIVDLGPADRIDAAVGRVRKAINGAAAGVPRKGEEKAEKALREPLAVLSKLVLAPLLPHAGKSRRWFVSPDGNLWLVPFEALLLSEGRYAIEKYQISYLTSGRDLLPGVAPQVEVGAPLVLADPDFDLAPSRARTAARRLRGAADEEDARALPGALPLGKVQRLAGTGEEARAIAPSLRRFAGVAPRVYLREQALEGVVKAARNPRVLVLCTHGFFLPDRDTLRKEKGVGGKAKPAKKWENPLLRCGLLLAGCNNTATATEGDDGVLTGLEVVGTDLRGCELVVLSACETGLGEVESGEGVAGLRQAFQLAGAQAVVSTLWQVPDKASARLMALFFQNLAAGQNKAQALQAAKLRLIAERRSDFAAAHPFFWAAFTLTGQP
jgi:CHAT domain-containing protein/tetratricopeptide (TPR) repeat protein